MKFIEKEDDIIVRIPRKIYDKHIQTLLDEIEFKKIIVKSKATQKDIDAIMLEIKKDRKRLMKPLLDRIKNITK
jgi:hypothetical protein